MLDAALRKAGATSVLLELPWSEHAFDAVPEGMGTQISLALHRTFHRVGGHALEGRLNFGTRLAVDNFLRGSPVTSTRRLVPSRPYRRLCRQIDPATSSESPQYQGRDPATVPPQPALVTLPTSGTATVEGCSTSHRCEPLQTDGIPAGNSGPNDLRIAQLSPVDRSGPPRIPPAAGAARPGISAGSCRWQQPLNRERQIVRQDGQQPDACLRQRRSAA